MGGYGAFKWADAGPLHKPIAGVGGWRRRGDGLWVEGANDCLQQIAADRFSTLQDVIAILLQGFVRPGWFHGRITSFVYS